MNYREHYKEQIKEILEGKSLEEAFQYCTLVGDKVEVIWSTNDLLKSNEIPLDLALRIAEYYCDDENPLPNDVYDAETRKGDDARSIATVRGSACWLLQTILGKFDTSYYPRVMVLLEKLCLAETEPNTYVRKNAAVPLSTITRNLRAKQNVDGTPFNIDTDTKAKAVRIAYQMLHENAEYPRVLEYIVTIFDGMRDITEAQAMLVLRTFFYKPDGTLQPEYLTRSASPLAIFYAEFRTTAFDDGFQDAAFKQFLHELIKKSGQEDPDLLATIVWHCWKSIKDDTNTLDRLSPYFPHFFEYGKMLRAASQLEFLANAVVEADFEAGIAIYNQYLDTLTEILRRDKSEERGHLAEAFNAGEVLMRLQDEKPQSVAPFIRKLTHLVYERIFVGHIPEYVEKVRGLAKDSPHYSEIRNELNKLIYGFQTIFHSDMKEVPE